MASSNSTDKSPGKGKGKALQPGMDPQERSRIGRPGEGAAHLAGVVRQDEALEAMNECSYMIADASEWLPRLSRQFLVTSFYEREKYNGVLVSQYLI